jgi:hypothetical protein
MQSEVMGLVVYVVPFSVPPQVPVTVTRVKPGLICTVHMDWRPWPTGLEVHVIEPPAGGLAEVVIVCWLNVKVAVQLLLPFIMTVVVGLAPEQSPDQPVKADPAPGTAVRVTVAPAL